MAAKIVGVEGLSGAQVEQLVSQGGKFVIFDWVVSVLVLTITQRSAIHFVKPGESAAAKGIPYTVLSLFLGWWGLPWGLIRTPIALATNLGGGRDVTANVMAALRGPTAPPPAAPRAPTAAPPMQMPTTGAPIKPR